MAISSGSKGAYHRKVACKCEGRISLDLCRDPCHRERSEAYPRGGIWIASRSLSSQGER
jgi:hypothetical protein